jgi:hypothetical protein
MSWNREGKNAPVKHYRESRADGGQGSDARPGGGEKPLAD